MKTPEKRGPRSAERRGTETSKPRGRGQAGDPQPLPWPREKANGTPLGIDLGARLSGRPPRPDPSAREGQLVADAVRYLVVGQFKRKRMPDWVRDRIDIDDLVGEVYLKILRKNRQACAFDPDRASFSKYVTIVAAGVIAAAMTRANRDCDLFAEPADLELDDDAEG